MKNRPTRTLAVAALLATSVGAEVMAGADGGLTVLQWIWFAGTVLAAGAAGVLAGPYANKKNRQVDVGLLTGSHKRFLAEIKKAWCVS